VFLHGDRAAFTDFTRSEVVTCFVEVLGAQERGKSRRLGYARDD
jgi:hypothetical protein